MSELQDIQALLRDFADRRDWQQFHTLKNLSTALVVEAGELAEIFQWKTPEECAPSALLDEDRQRLEDECADVAIYLLRLCDVAGIDLRKAVFGKIDRNERRFPV
jgi:NTP pyrophosphatase (non-canonical NTP hydrolase)